MGESTRKPRGASSGRAACAQQLFAGIGATSGVNYDIDNDMNATFNSFELDFDKDVGTNASLYVNNDFDVNLDHTETVIGFKYKF